SERGRRQSDIRVDSRRSTTIRLGGSGFLGIGLLLSELGLTSDRLLLLIATKQRLGDLRETWAESHTWYDTRPVERRIRPAGFPGILLEKLAKRQPALQLRLLKGQIRGDDPFGASSQGDHAGRICHDQTPWRMPGGSEPSGLSAPTFGSC